MSAAPALALQGLEVALATDAGPLAAVRGIDLEVAPGETLCIVGESGSGKSMTAYALMDILPRDATRRLARLELGGEDIGADASRLRALRGDRMAMIFQEPTTALNPAWTVGEQIIEGLLHHRPGTSRAAALDRAARLLETCGVSEPRLRLDQYPHQLSGGLRQRVMIAMALMTEPALLIADEPTTALDVTVKAQILALLARLRRELELAVILISHDLTVVRRVGQRLAVMYAGEIVESGPAEAVLAAPRHPYTRALIDCIPGPEDSAARGARLGHLPGQPPSLVGDLSGCQFRARCEFAGPACAGEIPVRRGGDRFHRCVLPEPPATQRSAPPRRAIAVLAPKPTGDPAIELRDVAVTYAVSRGLLARKGEIRALKGVDLQLERGGSLGIVGESGGGKSTLARVILGLETPTRGEARLFGTLVSAHGRAARARLIQPVFQDPYSSLNPRRDIAATIRLPLDVHGIGRPAEREARVRRLMDLCGLPARLATAYPAELSGGQRQRVAIAGALVLEPAILLCDEPTSALDVSVQSQILDLIADLRAELGLTLVVISHDMSVIRFLADRVAVLYLGAIVETGAADAVLGQPLHPYARMLAAASLGRGPEAERRAETAGGAGEGCVFRARCPGAMAICARTPPPLRRVAGRAYSCHFEATPEARV